MCEVNPNNFTTIEVLPPELLIHILQFLLPIEKLRSEQVSKKWRNAIRQMWRDVRILYILEPYFCQHHEFKYPAKLHELIEEKGNQLFIGSDSPKIIRCFVSRVGCSINKLTYDYADSKHHQAIISIITFYCRNLKVLVLGATNFFVDGESWSKLFEFNQELHSISSGYNKNCIEALPFKKWRSLHYEFTDNGHEVKIASLIEYSEALEEFGCDTYTTRIVQALLKLQNLKSLYIKVDSYLAPLSIILHVSLLNRLMELKIDSCYSYNIDPNMLCNVLQHCCQLKKLSIFCNYEFFNSVLRTEESGARIDVFPVMLLEVILALPNLETLGLILGNSNYDTLIRLTKFKNLLLAGIMRFATNNGIFQMIKNSEVLENLDIGSTGVTKEMLKKLVKEMSHRRKYLKVRVNRRIFDDVFKICAGSKIRVVKDMQYFNDFIR